MIILYKTVEGNIAVINPSKNALLSLNINDIADKDVPKGCIHKVESKDVLPVDYTFMAAWNMDDSLFKIENTSVIKVDILKAKEITKDILRKKREPLLSLLDIQTMNNLFNSVKLSEIEAQKQVLRDITLHVDALQTEVELIAIISSI